MPEKRKEVPEDLKDQLPTHAQHIYVDAYNSAYKEYADPEKRRGNESREEVAHKVAWAAVKAKYEKGNDGKWHPKKTEAR